MSTIPAQATIEEEGQYFKLKLWGCRTLYANVNRPREKNGEPVGYDCEWLLPKEAPGATAVSDTIRKAGIAKFGTKGWKSAVIKDGDRMLADEEAVAGVGNASDSAKMRAGHWVISANSGIAKPPAVKGIIYSGCYSGAVIMVQAYDFFSKQDQRQVKGVKGYLNAAQFHGHGQPLGVTAIDVEDELGVPTPPQDSVTQQPEDFGAGAYTGSNPPDIGAPHPADDDSMLPF